MPNDTMREKNVARPEEGKSDRKASTDRLRIMYALAAAIVIALLAWAYFDKQSREQDEQMAQLNLSIQKLADQQARPYADATQPAPEPAPAAKMNTYAAALGEQRFQIDLPEGHRLSFTEGAMGDATVYVVLESTPENEAPIPDMVISLVSLENEDYAAMLGKDEHGTRLVATVGGEYAFWIRGWEDLEWDGSAAVLASFKAL